MTVLLFAFLLATDIYGSILRNIPDLGYANIFVVFAFIFLCFKLVDFLFRERKVIEFDEENLYIIDKQKEQEECIPLKNLIKLNMRPMYLDIGNYWFNKHSLKFVDSLNQEKQTCFYIRTGSPNTQKFLSLVKSKNPDFIYKNWTHTFDISN